MIDIQILKFLYSKKNDGNFHDASIIFNITNSNYNYDRIEDFRDTAVIPESQDNSNIIRKLMNKLFKRTFDKETIDKCVVSLEENGYVTKNVKDFLPGSALTADDDLSDANNSICQITSKGIDYFENYQHNFKSRKIAVVSLIISVITLVILVLTFILNRLNLK